MADSKHCRYCGGGAIDLAAHEENCVMRQDANREALTPSEPTFPQALRSNAKFLMDCFDNLSRAEAQAVANKLNEAADALASVSETRELLPRLLRAFYGDGTGGEREAIGTAIEKVLKHFEPLPCNSEGMNNCVRCSTIYLAKVLRTMLNETREQAETEVVAKRERARRAHG